MVFFMGFKSFNVIKQSNNMRYAPKTKHPAEAMVDVGDLWLEP